jgi:hypothetical protein
MPGIRHSAFNFIPACLVAGNDPVGSIGLTMFPLRVAWRPRGLIASHSVVRVLWQPRIHGPDSEEIGGTTRPRANCALDRSRCTTSCHWWSRFSRSARLLPRHCLLCAIRPFQHDDPLVADIVVRDHPHSLEGVTFKFGFHSYLCALILIRSRELSCPRKDRVCQFHHEGASLGTVTLNSAG